MTDEPKPMTASEVIRRQEEWGQGLKTDPEKRIALAKLAVLKGDKNALDALAELALKWIKSQKA